jgi:hypothetical protein
VTKTLSIFVLLLLSGCEQPTKPTTEIASELAYFKDRFSICYAAVSSFTHSGYKVISITSVPCDKVNL